MSEQYRKSARAGGLVGTLGRFIGTLVVEFLDLIGRGIDRVIVFLEDWLLDAKRAQYGLAVTRILLGITGLGLLATNFTTRYYAFGSGSAWNGEAVQPLSDFPRIWLFSLFHRLALHDTWLTIATLGLALLGILVTLGWRTKIVLPIFFVAWVSYIEVNDSLGDQGDNMYRITLLTLLFADTSARWSLDERRRSRPQAHDGPMWKRALNGGAVVPRWFTNLLHNLALVAVTTHVCFVYAAGSLYKAGGAPWQHGYAVYNPLQTQRFGPWPELSDLFTAWGPMVTMISWSSIILQMCFPLMLLHRATRIVALLGIGSFHVGIAILMGLPWFSLAMIAIDAIFIRDVTWQKLGRMLRSSWQESRSGQDPPHQLGDQDDGDFEESEEVSQHERTMLAGSAHSDR